MFFGKVLTPTESFTFNEKNVDENAGQVLSITNAVLTPNSKENAALYVKTKKGQFLIASLTKERPHANINLFLALTDGVALVVKGNGSVHVVGFFEPQQDQDFLGEEDELQGVEEEDQDQDEQLDQIKPSVPKKNPLVVKKITPQQQLNPQIPQQPPKDKKSPQVAPQPPPQKQIDEDDDDDQDEEDEEDQDDEILGEDDDQQDDQDDEDQIDSDIHPEKKIKQGESLGFFGGKKQPQQNQKPHNQNQNQNKPQNPGQFQAKNQHQGGNQGGNQGGHQGGNRKNFGGNQGGKPFHKEGGNPNFNKDNRNFQGKKFNKNQKQHH